MGSMPFVLQQIASKTCFLNWMEQQKVLTVFLGLCERN